MTTSRTAPDGPGACAKWSDADKSAVGTAVTDLGGVWFTAAGGLVTEVFWPEPANACVRQVSFVVTDPEGTCDDESAVDFDVLHASDEVPLVTIAGTCRRQRYRLDKELFVDPKSHTLFIRVRLRPTASRALRLFCIVEPHLSDDGDSDRGALADDKGVPVLVASSAEGALALACSAPWLARGVGYAGTDSDVRRELAAHQALSERYDEAPHGHVLLGGELDPSAGDIILALSFARSAREAAHVARGALLRGYASARTTFIAEWRAWHAGLSDCHIDGARPRGWKKSATILKTFEAKGAIGGRVAGLATPWGASRGPGSDGTYHLVWTRDLAESLGGLLATGTTHEARRTLHYLRCTQEADGHWPQNMRLDGEAFWDNDELDETALPLLLLDLARRECALDDSEVRAHWPMVRRAGTFLARHGPSTTRDRWEDIRGVTPFTLATEVAALLVAAEVAELNDAPLAAGFWRALADDWNELADELLYRRGGALAERVGVEGYYVRTRTRGAPFVEPLDLDRLPQTEVSPDAIALVRFGLRAADDPRIADTVRVIDAILKTDFESGPSWRRYPRDAYGEDAHGAPFDGTGKADGIGRPWPLFTGERAHFELARGDTEKATALLQTMESFANASGYISEQVWDAADIRSRHLVRGQPTGSASPLGWAHAEYLKLARSLEMGAVFDRPQHAAARYVDAVTRARFTNWRVGTEPVPLRRGTSLRVIGMSPMIVTTRDGSAIASVETEIGIHLADISLVESRGATHIRIDDGEPIAFSYASPPHGTAIRKA